MSEQSDNVPDYKPVMPEYGSSPLRGAYGPWLNQETYEEAVRRFYEGFNRAIFDDKDDRGTSIS